jgi:flagellar motor protein MotB
MRRRSSTKKKVESWQIIYIDLMTNIMIFFVILWSINQVASKGISDTIGNESAAMVNLPGDVLFNAGRATISKDGGEVFKKLFTDTSGAILNFDTNALTKRLLVIHGHTDNDGTKEKNLDLGFQRALAAYREIRKYSKDLNDHVVICSHADNSPSREIPKLSGKLGKQQLTILNEAKAKNRRITIEDKIMETNTPP